MGCSRHAIHLVLVQKARFDHPSGKRMVMSRSTAVTSDLLFPRLAPPQMSSNTLRSIGTLAEVSLLWSGSNRELLSYLADEVIDGFFSSWDRRRDSACLKQQTPTVIVAIIMRFPFRVFLKQIQNDRWLVRSKFLGRSVDGKHLARFQRETSVFKFLLCSVDGDIWRVFSVKPPFSNSSGEVWMENIWRVFRVKPPFSNSSNVV